MHGNVPLSEILRNGTNYVLGGSLFGQSDDADHPFDRIRGRLYRKLYDDLDELQGFVWRFHVTPRQPCNPRSRPSYFSRQLFLCRANGIRHYDYGHLRAKSTSTSVDYMEVVGPVFSAYDKKKVIKQ